jgi:hypothetical protein
MGLLALSADNPFIVHAKLAPVTPADVKKCEQCGRKYDKGFRGLLTVLVVILSFGLAYVQLLRGGSETLIPPWVGILLGSVVSMYFMGRTGERMREITREQSGSPQPPASLDNHQHPNNQSGQK